MGRGLIDIKEIKFYKMCYLMQKNTINYIDGKFLAKEVMHDVYQPYRK